MLEDLSGRPAPEAPAPPPDRTKEILAAISKVESGSGDKRLVRAVEQVSVMREDFGRLCAEIRGRIGDMDAETVLSSFEAYRVDMENILTDAGVYIGSFDYDVLNTRHQRIVGVVPTDDPSMDGAIAERLSDGYMLGDRVLVKERVTVYKCVPPEPEAPPEAADGTEADAPAEEAPPAEAAEEPPIEEDSPESPDEGPEAETPSETASETTSETVSEDAGGESPGQEEQE